MAPEVEFRIDGRSCGRCPGTGFAPRTAANSRPPRSGTNLIGPDGASPFRPRAVPRTKRLAWVTVNQRMNSDRSPSPRGQRTRCRWLGTADRAGARIGERALACLPPPKNTPGILFLAKNPQPPRGPIWHAAGVSSAGNSQSSWHAGSLPFATRPVKIRDSCPLLPRSANSAPHPLTIK